MRGEHAVRSVLTTALEVAGLAAISVGFGLVFLPAGLIAGGAAAVLVGWRLA